MARAGGAAPAGGTPTRAWTGSRRQPVALKRWIALTVVVGLLVWLAYVVFLVQPSNRRDWEFGVDTLPAITFGNGTVHVQNVRDFRWTADGGVQSADFVDLDFDVARIERAWFIEEPFTLAPFDGFEGVAHTYFVFDFQDRAPVAISVESRRERGESYDPLRGMLKQYELIYIWGSEQDLTGRRAVLEKNDLYMYPLNIPLDSARELFLQLAQATHELEDHPRFYNTLTSNCTNELAKVANLVKPNVIEPNIALIFPGYSENVLYDLGFIPTDVSLQELRTRSYISDLVVAVHEKPDFSNLLRAELKRRGAIPGS